VVVESDAFRNALILTGPTASGKSAVALAWAEQAGAEIVAMDSMTVYRGLDVGTAKPTPQERARVPHHLIDVLDPWESANVAWWLRAAAAACRAIEQRGKVPLIAGGTPLYLKALLFGLFEGPPGDVTLRASLETEAQQLGAAHLHARLATVDPTSARRLHANDLRRVVRALEVWELTGRPLSSWQEQWTTAAAERLRHQPPACWRIDWPRAELYARSDARVSVMLATGWLDEVRRLRELPRPLSRPAAQALGYQELLAYLERGGGLSEVVEIIRRRSRQFAKRQLTWLRNLSGLHRLSGPLTPGQWAATITAFRDRGENSIPD
jgi:tRNA dimethylallyltransferase